MKYIEKETFVAWEEPDANTNSYARAIAIVSEKGYFDVAINCPRNLRDKSKNRFGIYNEWCYNDSINYPFVKNVRPANPAEVNLYLSLVPIEADDDRNISVVRGYFSSDILYEYREPSIFRRVLYNVCKMLGFIHEDYKS